MCGLFGVAVLSQPAGFSENDLHRARRARDSLLHRGPDQSGEIIQDGVYMGHRRLSILDLSDAGRQPMVSGDGDVAITVNGEVYNFRRLRKELEDSGIRFKSSSDSEVVLHGYKHWGIDGLAERIDGMYAIVIHDRKSGLVYFVRDRVGIKPLYYARVNGLFLWASELKAIKSFLGLDMPEKDNFSLYDFITYSYIPAPKTAYKNIYKLPPAHVLRCNVQSSSLETWRYWDVPHGHVTDSDAVVSDRLENILKESVSEQMVSDVPVGVFLSGGVDSSIIAGLASSDVQDIKTFNISFGVPGYDESVFAEEVAHFFRTSHQRKVISSDIGVDFSDWLLSLYDEPLATNSALPTWCVSQFAKDQVTVALGGDGGDELFGGYKWYRMDTLRILLFKILSRIPSFVWRLPLPGKKGARFYANAVSGAKSRLEIHNNLYFTKISGAERRKYREILSIPDDYDDMWFFRQYYKPELGPRKWRQYLDFHCFLPEMVLTKVDRASMAHGLEVRVPFLSKPMIEFAFSLPEKFIYKSGNLKGGLKWAFRNALPASILTRGKQGFSLPWDSWRKDLIRSEGHLQDVLFNKFYNS